MNDSILNIKICTMNYNLLGYKLGGQVVPVVPPRKGGWFT